MSALAAGLGTALLGSAALLLLVLALRLPARRCVGPRLAYTLWALPALRLVLPPLPDGVALPVSGTAAAKFTVLFAGTPGTGTWHGATVELAAITTVLVAIWLIGAAAVLALQAWRHRRFCQLLLASATPIGSNGSIRIVEADVDGPLAFGVIRRRIALPRDFTRLYNAREQRLALAHELAHHARRDLLANWASLAVLAAHWWNPIAWVAIAAFREDQEFATDAHVVARAAPGDLPIYARVLAKAVGIGALPVCNLNPRSNLKGRLMMIARKPLSGHRIAAGSTAMAIVCGVALAATLSGPGAAASAAGQAVTIGVKPDGAGHYSLIIGSAAFAPGARLPGGATLPADFDASESCNLKPDAKPVAMVIKGQGGGRSYSVMCASAGPAAVRATLDEGLASLRTMRASVASQPASKVFPEAERKHALGAIDRSIAEVEASRAAAR